MFSLDSANKIVRFATYAPDLLGNNFDRVKVLGFLDHKSVFQYIDPVAMHANVYPYLPVGVPNDYSKYMYVKVQFANGKEQCLGIPWIDPNTIEEIVMTTYLITVRDQQASDEQGLREMMLANGKYNFTIEAQ